MSAGRCFRKFGGFVERSEQVQSQHRRYPSANLEVFSDYMQGKSVCLTEKMESLPRGALQSLHSDSLRQLGLKVDPPAPGGTNS
jgi:hypothetical protein